ncbi:MAG: HAD family phosphatase [Ruminococcaceae bacterium]|nr:HAD family phosphatase [Oscillospiraceae bacterium]
MMIKGILFDMDGVLFDTERLALQADDAVAAEMGYTLSDTLKNSLMGLGEAEVRRLFYEELGPDFDYDTFLRRVLETIMHWIETRGLPKKPGVDALLAWARAQGYQLAVASSTRAPMVHKLLARAGIDGYFSAVVGGDMVPDAKPAPDIFLAAAKALNLAPGQCLAVEDSHHGVCSAAAAGCVTVMVPDILAPTPEIESMCAAVHASLEDIPAFLADYSGD